MTESVRLSVTGAIATLWLDRPEKRNAMNASMWAALPALVDRAADDAAVRVLVVRGTGEHFCAGADIAELGTSLAADSSAVAYRTLNARAEASLAGAPLPTIAAIDGACIGGGVQLALACDLRLGTDRARLGITAAKLGISFPAPSLERLVATVGAPRARRMLMTAEVLGAAEAARIGLLDEVVGADDLEPALAGMVTALTAASAVTQLAAKEMIDEVTRTGSVTGTLATEWERLAAQGDDLTEGLVAFSQRRPPAFGPRPARPRRPT